MILLLPFAFLAGIVTVLSPCILPILPIILSGAVGENKRKPLGIVIGFVSSFTFFTLFLTTLVKASGISADLIRQLSIVIVFGFGLTLIFPKAQLLIERLFSQVSAKFQINQQNKTGMWGGFLIGMSLGLLWTPCVGPILATVISLALTESVSSSAVLITLAYALGTAIPMFAIMRGGQTVLQKNRWVLSNGARIQQAFGVLMIATAVAIFFNVDRQFQTIILRTFPDYGTGLTKFEQLEFLQPALEQLRGNSDNNQTRFQNLPRGLSNFGPAPELVTGGEWYNIPAEHTNSLTLKELKDNVVLIDFWTYSCINCIRTLPYLRSWHEKYKDQGLVIIGVHSPEFEFEKNPENVRKAISDFEISYPVMQDNNFATWNAYKNRFWPAKYLIDKDGIIRYQHFGEGAYDETELAIQELLRETGQSIEQQVINPQYTITRGTPELYLGYNRMEFEHHPGSPIQPDVFTLYPAPKTLPPIDEFSFIGNWIIRDELSQAGKDAKLLLYFQAKEVFLVMSKMDEGLPATVEVFLDNQPVTEEIAGEDVIDGKVTITKDRLYKLLNLPEAGNHYLELRFPDGNVQVFAFTFG